MSKGLLTRVQKRGEETGHSTVIVNGHFTANDNVSYNVDDDAGKHSVQYNWNRRFKAMLLGHHDANHH
eukprot:3075414-Pyramimonas_sp.AAC.1